MSGSTGPYFARCCQQTAAEQAAAAVSASLKRAGGHVTPRAGRARGGRMMRCRRRAAAAEQAREVVVDGAGSCAPLRAVEPLESTELLALIYALLCANPWDRRGRAKSPGRAALGSQSSRNWTAHTAATSASCRSVRQPVVQLQCAEVAVGTGQGPSSPGWAPLATRPLPSAVWHRPKACEISHYQGHPF